MTAALDRALAISPLWDTQPVSGASLATPVIGLGQLTWNATDAETGVDFICEDLTGWADLPASNAPVLNRTFDHGAWSGPGWYGPRVLELHGALAAPDRASLQAALHKVRGEHARALTESSVLSVLELDGEKRLGVRAGSPILAVHYVSAIAARVTFELVAPWPVKRSADRSGSAGAHERGIGRRYPRPSADDAFRRYGAPSRTGDLHLINAGNAPVRPTFVFAGPSRNPQVAAVRQGRTLRFLIDLAAQDRLFVDEDTHAVLLNEVGNRRHVLSHDSAWFDLLPGDNWLQYRSDDNSGTLTVTYTDGWW
jgi:hypothetical protein